MALGPGLSIGITIVVTPFIDVLAARLLLFWLEEFPSNAYRSLRHEPLSHGFGVVPLTPARLERLFCPGVLGDRSPDLFLHSREVSGSRASAHRSWILLLFPRDRAMTMFWVPHCTLPPPFAPLISPREVVNP